FHLCLQERTGNFLFSALCVAAAIQAAWGFFVWWGGGDTVPTQSGTFYAPNQYAGYLLSLAPLLVSQALFVTKKTEAAAWGFMSAFVYLAVVLSGSRGGMAAAGLSVLALLALLVPLGSLGTTSKDLVRRAVIRFLVLALFFLAAGLFITSSLSLSGGAVEKGVLSSVAAKSGSELNTVNQRIHWGLGSILIAQTRPLTGSGLGTYGDMFVQVQAPEWAWSRYAHNHYAESLAEGGLGLFAGVVAISFVALNRQRPIHDGSLSFGRRMGVWAGLVGAAAHLGLDFDWTFPGFSATFVVLAALLTASRSTGDEPREGPRKLQALLGLVATMAFLVAGGAIVSNVESTPGAKPSTNDDLRKAIVAAPYSTSPRKLLAVKLARAGSPSDIADAISLLETSARLDELDPQVLWVLAQLRTKGGEIGLANELYAEAVDVALNAPLSYQLSGEFKLRVLQEPLEAAEVLDEGIQRISLRPDQSRLSSLLSVLLLLRSEAEEASWGPIRARRFALQATQVAPSSATAWTRYGTLSC
ncbi:MAG: O-antigen ligase family protein, partial [Acidimicrobiia bacterium]